MVLIQALGVTLQAVCNSTKLHKFDNMELQVDIGFDQLVKLAKQLPATQWTRLKREVDKEKIEVTHTSDLEIFLLSAPTFNKKQLNEIATTRKAISQWRTK